MMDIERLLFDLCVYSADGYGYVLTCDAINLRLVCGEDWEPSLKELQREVGKLRTCTYDTFLHDIKKISKLAWSRNKALLEKYAHRDLEKAPTVKDFLDIFYTYILRTK